MPPIQDRPRSLFGPKSRAGWGPFLPSPASSFVEELPTTPLPATNSQLEQTETVILPAQLTPVPPVLRRQLSNPGVMRPLSGVGVTRQFSQPGITRQPGSPRITRQLSHSGLAATEEERAGLQVMRPLSGVGVTRQFSQPGITRQPGSPRITRQLSHSGLVATEEEGAGPRATVVIKGDLKKPVAVSLTTRAHKKRRLLVSLSAVFMLMLITAFALLSASPLGHDVGMNFSAQSSGNTMVSSGNNDGLKLIAQATATAISNQQQDGYDPYSNGSITVSDGSGSLNWPTGQCTFWANYRYHELTGFWVSWTGNAAQWVAGARAAGWNVSTQPHIPSILVLMPYVQGAWGYGHVAVVESVNDTVTPEVVHTSNMNWWVNGGGWNKESSYDFTVGQGVYFVWHK